MNRRLGAYLISTDPAEIYVARTLAFRDTPWAAGLTKDRLRAALHPPGRRQRDD